MKILFWNVAGLKNKNTEFFEYLEEFDFVGLIETWVDEGQWNELRNKMPESFDWKFTPAKRESMRGRASGGIITGIKRSIKEDTSIGPENQHIQVRKIRKQNKVWQIVTVYNRCREDETLKKIDEFIQEDEENFLIVGGDLNARIGEEGSIGEDGEDRKRRSKDKIINAEGRALIALAKKRGWYILNGNIEGDDEGHFTYIGHNGESLIDYVIVNNNAREQTNYMEVAERTESDHLPLNVVINKGNTEYIDARTPEKKEIYVWNEHSVESYKRKIEQLQWEDGTVEEELTDIVQKTIASSHKVTIKNKTKENQEWWDSECREAKRKMKKSLRDWKRNGGSIERYREGKKAFRKLCNEKKMLFIKAQEEEISKIQKENEMWGFIRNKKKRMGIPSSISKTDWLHYFKELLGGSKEQPNLEAQANLANGTGEEENDVITECDVREAMKKLKRKKAGGEDKTVNEMYMYGNDKLVERITRILNRVWKGEKMPDRWRLGVISPIYKKGDKHNVNNYRGVTLLDVTYKIYATILNEKLKNEIDAKNILPDTQAGFRKKRGAMDNVYILKQAIEEEIHNKKEKCYAFFADIKAAFDQLDRAYMWKTLTKLGIKQRLREKIQEIYQETRNAVKISDEMTEIFWTRKGVRQGCPLSATLFTLYVADLEEVLRRAQDGGLVIGTKKFWSLTYADDVVLLARTEQEMQQMLVTFKKYLEKREMQLSTPKSKMIVFRKGGGGREARRKWNWGTDQIEEVKTIKYLGYQIMRTNRNEAHIQYITEKGTRAMKQIWSKGETDKWSYKMRVLAFEAMVKSIILYGAEIWGYKEYKSLEKIQEKYFRWITTAGRSTAAYIIMEETKRKKIRYFSGKVAMKYEEKMEEARNEGKELLAATWEAVKNRTETNLRTPWMNERKTYYESNGFNPSEAVRRRRDNPSHLNKICERDYERQQQAQTTAIDNSTYTRYRMIRTNSEPKYLTVGHAARWQVTAAFRCGTMERNNQVWRRPEDRICRLCGRGPDSLEHWTRECTEAPPDATGRSARCLLSESGNGWKTLEILKKKLSGQREDM